MITSVAIEGFRGVREGAVEGLAPISILVGPNNTGKSTVLEAIAAVGLGGDARGVAGLLLRRGGPPLNALARTVWHGAKQASVSVGVGGAEPGEQWVTRIGVGGPQRIDRFEQNRRLGLDESMEAIRVDAARGLQSIQTSAYVDIKGKRSEFFIESGGIPEAPHAFVFVDVEAVRGAGELEDAYSRIDEAKQLGTVVKALGRSMGGLTDLRILKVGTEFLLHTFFADEPPVPAYLAGDGFKRFLALAAAAVATPKGVVLLEEPEVFQHPRYLRELATLLLLAARGGTQIILSTHSLELIDLLLLAPEAEGQGYPAMHRLSLHEGKLRSTSIPSEDAARGREGLLEDLRT
jgi:predicted ATPase